VDGQEGLRFAMPADHPLVAASIAAMDSYLFFILNYAEPLVTPLLTSWRKLTVFCLAGFR